MGEIYRNGNTNTDDNTHGELCIGEIIEPIQSGVKFRDKEIGRIRNIMGKTSGRTVLLVGEHGCGKRTIVGAFAASIRGAADECDVFRFDATSLIKIANSRREFEDALKDVFDDIEKNFKNNILNINNLGHIINFNCYENYGYMFLSELVKEIEIRNLRVIATTTDKEYSELENHFPKVLDSFTVIKVPELTMEQTGEILRDRDVPMFEFAYGIRLPQGVVEDVCENADKYIKNSAFPKKAKNLLDEVCSYISHKYSDGLELNAMKTEYSDMRAHLIESIRKGDYNACDRISGKMEELNGRICGFTPSGKDVDVSDNDVLEAVGFILDVPMTKLSKDRTLFLKTLPDEIRKDIIGQDETVDKVVKNIRRNQLGLRKKAHSAGNYMFIGSTGVGKTALAKSLAKNLYGSEESIVRFDMSEFQTEVDVTKLLGSAPGYVGYKESGLLVKALAKRPECVCLFDEIEKAHPKIYDVLLQLLDEGSITGSDGVKVDGSRALIIFTSNIGVKSAKELANPMGITENYDELKSRREESIMLKALKKRFSPEFLNRLDAICYFNNLSRDVLDSILMKEMGEMNKGIRNITNKEVVLSDEVRTWILDKVELEHNGARPIIRLLEQEIEEEVANLVINESKTLNRRGGKLTAKLKGDKILLK